MKRRYKLLIIILIGSIMAIIINFSNKSNKLNIISIGDGVPKGITSLDKVGISYNDYLYDYLNKRNKINSYNTSYVSERLTIGEVLELLNANEDKNSLKQIIAKSNILIINIGMDELVDSIMRNRLTEQKIIDFIDTYYLVINNIRKFYDKEIIIMGLYPYQKMNQSFVYEVNKRLRILASKYKCDFIDLMSITLNTNYFPDNNSYYMNDLGHKYIFTLLINLIN